MRANSRRRETAAGGDAPAAVAVLTITHRATAETRYRTVKRGGESWTVTEYRWRCRCGHATRWMKDRRASERARDRHAFDGQLGMVFTFGSDTEGCSDAATTRQADPTPLRTSEPCDADAAPVVVPRL